MESEYDLEIPRIVEEIRKQGAKKILLHLPDGLKAKATELIDELKLRTHNLEPKTEFYIYAGSNFGGCDLPLHHARAFDLIVSFGHEVFKR